MGAGITGRDKTEAGGAGEESKRPSPSGSSNSGGRGGRTGGGTTGGKGTTEKPGAKGVELPDVVVKVDVPGETKTTEQKRGRGRPAGSTTKNKSVAKKAAAAPVDPTHFIVLLQTVSGILASREGMQMFMLSKEEATQIATPLASILSKSDAVGDFAGQYADHIALLVACGAIFVPKFLMWQMLRKEQKAMLPKSEEVKPDAGTITRSAPKDDRASGNSEHVQNDVRSFGGSINDFISPII